MAARMSQRTGADFELVVCHRLRLLGCEEVEQVATPMRQVRGVWVRARKVSCDIKAIIPPTGRAVYVECKLRPGAKLAWDDLEDHQHRRMANAAAAGALAVIAFSDTGHGIELIDYSNALRLGWARGSPLSSAGRAMAAAVHWPRFKDQPPMN